PISGPPDPRLSRTAGNGTWTGTPPIACTYQWQRCDSAGNNCTDIPGATGSTYTLTSDDVGSTTRGVVTATNSGGSATSATLQTGQVDPVAPANTGLPTISGTPALGEPLTTTDGTWSGPGS